jgi:microcystin-dependent protein
MAQPYVGEIRMFAGNFAPQGWAFCDGALQSIIQNDTLFNLIGTTYGGDGQNTFALPNLQGRIPVHQGQGPGLTNRTLGAAFGQETVTLTVSEMPAHTHPAPCSKSGNRAAPGNNFWAADGSGNIAPYSTQGQNGSMAAGTISTAGGSQPHTNGQPVLVVNFIISLYGLFPAP